jgi:hypothetical protein
MMRSMAPVLSLDTRGTLSANAALEASRPYEHIEQEVKKMFEVSIAPWLYKRAIQQTACYLTHEYNKIGLSSPGGATLNEMSVQTFV